MRDSYIIKKQATSQRTVLRVDDDVEFVLSSNMAESINSSFTIPSEKSIEQSRRTYSKINPVTFVQHIIPKERFIEEKCVSPIRKPRTGASVQNIKTRNTVLTSTPRISRIVQKVEKKLKRDKSKKVKNSKKLQLCNVLLSSMNSSKNTVKKSNKITYDFPKCGPKLIGKTLRNNGFKREIDTELKTDFLSKQFFEPSTSSSTQINTHFVPEFETKNSNVLYSSGKKFDLKKIKKEPVVDSPLKPVYESGKEALVMNEADTAPDMRMNSMHNNDRACTSQYSLKLSPSVKWLSPNVISAHKAVTKCENERSRNLPKKENDVPENCSIIVNAKIKQRKRKREIDKLYENLKEISWVQNGSFKSLLCDKNVRHSERVTSKSDIGKLRKHNNEEAKKKKKKSSAASKKRNIPLLMKKAQTAAPKQHAPKVPVSLSIRKIDSKKPPVALKRMRRCRTNSKSLNEVEEVITLSDDSETPSPEVKSKLKKSNLKSEIKTNSPPEIIQCSTSADSFIEKKRRKRLPKSKSLSIFNGVNIFQGFLGKRRMIPSMQRPPELRVSLEPLEKTNLCSEEYLESAKHKEYENFRNRVIQQAMLKAFDGADRSYIDSVFKQLHENLTAPPESNVKNTKKRKREEESVRSSLRQSECAFRYKEIVVKKQQNYIQVVLVPNRNKQNSLTIEAMKELKEAFLSAKKDPNCKAVLLNSSGSFFCSGLDLGQLMGANKKHVAEEMAVTLRDLLITLGSFTKPVVAAVNGAAIGFGVALLTFCDIVLASDKATFCIPASKLGYVPEGAVTLTLPQVVGAGVAIEMLLQGRRLTAQQALKHGLVSEVLWPTQLMEEVIPRIQLLVSQPLQVMEATKALVRCHLWEKIAVQAEQEWKSLPPQWLEQSCQHNIKEMLKTGWTTE